MRLDNMSKRFIDNGHYRVTIAEAVALCRAADLGICFGGLPRKGYEKRVRVNGSDGWLTRTVVRGKKVWAVHGLGPEAFPDERGGK